MYLIFVSEYLHSKIHFFLHIKTKINHYIHFYLAILWYMICTEIILFKEVNLKKTSYKIKNREFFSAPATISTNTGNKLIPDR